MNLPTFNPVAQLLAAGHYAKHGWDTVDHESPKRQQHDARKSDYEKSLKVILAKIAKCPSNVNQIAETLGIKPATVKKHIAELFKRGLIEREKDGVSRKPTFIYFVDSQ